MAAVNAPGEPILLTSNIIQWPVYHGYKPLDRAKGEIRLLSISCENEGAVLSCELMHRSLEERPQYIALSYYWGAPGNLKAILINDVEVTVRETLHGFLQRLCTHFGPILVWLDAICINQHDTSERNWQVSLMQEIYEHAEKVYAWLGEGNEDCRFAMRYVRLKSHATTDIPLIESKLLLQYFEQLFLQPYWSRIWIIQEAVLANQFWLFCGSETILWDDLVLTFDNLLDNKVELFPHSASRKIDYWDETEPVEETEACSRFLRFKQARDSLRTEKLGLLELAELFRQHNSTDPRDKLYGLRGIAKDGKFLRVDYGQSATKVFLDALRLNTPTIERYTPDSYGFSNGKLDYAMKLCSSIQMSETDIMAVLQDTKCHSLLEWIHLRDEVLSCEPATELPRFGNQQYWEIISVHDKIYYSTSQNVQPGDKIYVLSTPGEGDEESDEAIRPFSIVFRNSNAHAKAVDKLISVDQMHNLKTFRESTVDMLLREYNSLRNACVGRIELCRTNTPMLHYSPPQPGLMLAHISYATMLTLTAWFKCKRIPEYLNHYNRDNPVDIHLCRCPESARILIDTDPFDQSTTILAPWSSTNTFEVERLGEDGEHKPALVEKEFT